MAENDVTLVHTTLAIAVKDDEVLLALKKRGFGKGKYNGAGGKVEKGETSEASMIRECQEEICIRPTKYKNMGSNEFIEFYKGQKEKLIFDIYIITEWVGEPAETEEMKPKWFKLNDIPYDQMFEDDQYWLPLVLDGKRIKGNFVFDKNWKLQEHNIEVVDE